MKLYKDGHEAYVEKDQVDLFIADGWSKNESEPETSDDIDAEETSDNVEETSDDLEESSEESTKTGKIRRPIKKK